MDKKLKKSIPFNPQINGKNEVVNQTIVHLLQGYCAKHPKLWDEQLHSYNKAMHSSSQKSPFETCFGYFPKSPLDFLFGKDTVECGQVDVDKF